MRVYCISWDLMYKSTFRTKTPKLGHILQWADQTLTPKPVENTEIYEQKNKAYTGRHSNPFFSTSHENKP